MSEFRLFCIVAFVSTGLIAAACNYGLLVVNDRMAPSALGLMLGFASVYFFGKRAS